MFKQNTSVTIPTEALIRCLVRETDIFYEENNLQAHPKLDTRGAAEIVTCAIYDVLQSQSAFVENKDSAETLMGELFPWYENNTTSSRYYIEVFDDLFRSTEQLLTELVSGNSYDVWQVRVLNNLTTHIQYLGDYRILEWEKQNGKQQRDVYVTGEECPRIVGTLISMGYYRKLYDGHTLKYATDVDGAIVDYYGNIVLTQEDINAGIRFE